MAAVKESLKMYLDMLDAHGAEVRSDPQLRKLDMASWRKHVRQQHVPFRKDCRVCLESMGTSHPHRRSHNASSSFTMSLDLAGPYQVGRDLGTGKSCRYMMVAVVPIPVLHELPVAHEIPDLQPEDVEEAPEHPEEEEPEEPVEDVEQDVVNALNEKANIEEMAEPASVQNVTLMETGPISTCGPSGCSDVQTSCQIPDVGDQCHAAAHGPRKVFSSCQSAAVVRAAPAGPDDDVR